MSTSNSSGSLPLVGAAIDVGHAHLTRWGTYKLLHSLGSRVGCFHINDNDGVRDSHSPAGEGTFDLVEFEFCYQKYTSGADCVLEYAPGVTPERLGQDINLLFRSLPERK